MPNMTLSIPNNLHKKMKKHSEIRWSEVVRQSIAKKVENLEMMDKITSKSKLSLKDVEEIASSVNKGVSKHLGLS